MDEIYLIYRILKHCFEKFKISRKLRQLNTERSDSKYWKIAQKSRVQILTNPALCILITHYSYQRVLLRIECHRMSRCPQLARRQLARALLGSPPCRHLFFHFCMRRFFSASQIGSEIMNHRYYVELYSTTRYFATDMAVAGMFIINFKWRTSCRLNKPFSVYFAYACFEWFMFLFSCFMSRSLLIGSLFV